MSKLYYLNSAYCPSDAVTNRSMAFIKGMSELGVEATVVYFFPDAKRSKVEGDYPHITFWYLWEKHYSKNAIIKGLRYLRYILHFRRILQPGDKVRLYNMEDVLEFLLKKKGISIFMERGELPTIYPIGSKIRRPSLSQYFRDLMKINGMIVGSGALKDYFMENGIEESNLLVVEMIIDSNRFKGVAKNTDKEKYIAYCGTASNSKDGVDQLIKSFAIVSRKHPEFKLYIIGRIPSCQESENLQLIRNLGLEGTVVLTGIVSPTIMPQILTDAQIVALDRPNNEQAKYGFPSKLGEYLLSRNPTVVTSVGDIPLYLKDGYNALLAEPDNVEAFADKLLWAIEHPNEAREIGERGYQLAMSTFNHISQTRRVIEFMNRNAEVII